MNLNYRIISGDHLEYDITQPHQVVSSSSGDFKIFSRFHSAQSFVNLMCRKIFNSFRKLKSRFNHKKLVEDEKK